MVILNAIALIIIVGGGGWLNWDDLKQAWVRFKERVKPVGAWGKLLWRGIRKILAGVLLLLAFGFILAAFRFFWSDIVMLYEDLSILIKNLPKLTNSTDVVLPEQTTNTGIIFSISIRYFGIVAAAGAIIGYIIAIARNLISDNQNKISEQGRIAEQISRAIDQIGAYKQNFDNSKDNKPNIEARVGGIYSLERIAKDSDDDYEKIMDILCAYVRVTALKKYKAIREDIQGAIDVLGTKKKSLLFWRRDKFRVNLENCNLSGYRFSELNFNTYTDSSNGTIFDKSKFYKSKFYKTDLSYASFDNSNLTEADFEEAELKGARFEKANCRDAVFKNANFCDAVFKETKVHGADFSKAKYLTQNQVNEMIGDKRTKVPKGMKLLKIEKIPKLKKS